MRVGFRMVLNIRRYQRFIDADITINPEPIIAPDLSDPAAGLIGKRFRVTLP